jgi:hypothetical protein
VAPQDGIAGNFGKDAIGSFKGILFGLYQIGK